MLYVKFTVRFFNLAGRIAVRENLIKKELPKNVEVFNYKNLVTYNNNCDFYLL